MLNIEKTIENGKAVYALEGRLDTVTAPDFEKELKESIADVTELTLDLEKLDYISSAGLRVLLSAQNIMNSQGEMILTNVSDSIMEILEITEFTQILTIR